MATTKKAITLANELVSELKQRQSARAVTLSFAALDGSPLILVGAGTIGSASALIKVKPIEWPLAKDVLGLTSTVYTPHQIQVQFEEQAGGTDPNTIAQKLEVLGPVLARGTRVEIFESNNGSAVTEAEFADPTQLKATYEPSTQWGMMSSQ